MVSVVDGCWGNSILNYENNRVRLLPSTPSLRLINNKDGHIYKTTTTPLRCLKRVFGINQSQIDIDIVEYEIGNSTKKIGVPRVNMGGQGDRPHRGQEETSTANGYVEC